MYPSYSAVTTHEGDAGEDSISWAAFTFWSLHCILYPGFNEYMLLCYIPFLFSEIFISSKKISCIILFCFQNGWFSWLSKWIDPRHSWIWFSRHYCLSLRSEDHMPVNIFRPWDAVLDWASCSLLRAEDFLPKLKNVYLGLTSMWENILLLGKPPVPPPWALSQTKTGL